MPDDLHEWEELFLKTLKEHKEKNLKDKQQTNLKDKQQTNTLPAVIAAVL